MAAGAAGVAAASFTLTLANSSATSTNPSQATISLTRAGLVSVGGVDLSLPSASYNWIAPAYSTVGDLWEIKVDITSGTFNSGTTGTWLPLSSTQTWTKSAVGTVNANMSIGRVGTSTALITKTLALIVN